MLLRDKETKASRGLGFITFECTEDCEDAVRGMNGQVHASLNIGIKHGLKSSATQ